MSAKKVDQLRRRQLALMNEINAGDVSQARGQVIAKQARRLELEIRRLNGDALPELPLAERLRYARATGVSQKHRKPISERIKRRGN
jgi:hypothetical protein